jgi:REP element-mobilizing transposase RayT
MKQQSFKKVNGWGGKRKGAGRPNKTGTLGHTKRDKVGARNPLHLTLKVKNGTPLLRTKTFLKVFQNALRQARRYGLKVNHFSVLNDHIHLIAEVDSNRDLACGMKSLMGRLGHFLSTGGAVFAGRFHLHALKTPSEMKNALRYVLLNQARHRRVIAYLDEFSTARYFDRWNQLLGRAFEPLLRYELSRLKPAPQPDYLTLSHSWLGTVGWLLVPT